METVLTYLSFVFLGIVLGGLLYSLIIARDRTLVHLHVDEVIIKRPMPEFVLVQVTPEIARRLVQYEGDLEPKNSSEARALYPERATKRATT